MIVGHVITLWITYGSLTIDKPTKILPLSVDGCTNETFSAHILTPASVWTPPPNTYFDFGNDTGDYFYDVINTTRAAPS